MRDIVMVVGSGMMGSGIGAMSALAGNKTVLVDTSAERAENGRKKAIECIRLREENELNTHEEAEKAIELLSTSDDSIKTAENARLVIEAIIENVEAKQNLFAQLDAVLPVEVPICSNTSGLRITDISAKCVHPERTVTGTVRCIGGLAPVVSVRTEGEVPKEKVFDVAHALNTALAHLPIAAGDVVIPDVCGTGVNVIATKSAK